MKEGWEYIDFKDVYPVKMGKTPPRGDKSSWDEKKETNNKWVSIADISNNEGKIIEDTKEYISDTAAAKINKVAKGSLLMSFKLSIGRMAFAGDDLYTNEAIIAIPKNDKYILRFIYFYLLSYDWLSLTEGSEKVKGATLNKSSIGKIQLPILSLSEQQSIVDYLDSSFAKIDAMKANAEKALNEAKALFQASLKEMLEPKEEWEEKYLKDIAQYSIGLTYKPTNVCNDGTIVLRSSNIQEGKLDLNDIVRVNANIKDDLFVQTGDILMCSRNGSARLVGKVCIIPELKEKMTYGTFMMIIRSAYNPLLYHYFDTGLFRSQIKHGEANMINQITRYMLDEVKLNLPPITEQQSIVATLDSLKSKVDRLQANYNKISQECDALKQAILRQVFE